MDSHLLKNKEDCLNWVSQSGDEVACVEHEAVPTMEAVLEKVKFDSPVTYCKNLFLKDKKKKEHYLVVARHDTQVSNQALAFHLGTSKNNIRNGEADTMKELLGTVPGSVNLFAILNDSDEKVKLIVDKHVMDADFITVHPMDNTATCRVSKEMTQRIIDTSNHEPDVIDFEALNVKF